MLWAVEKRLVCRGVSSKLCLLRVCSFCLLVRLSRSLLGLLFCVYLCLAPGSGLSFARWVSGLERVVGSYGGPLVSLQAVCDTYVNQVNKEKLHRCERANCGYLFLTFGFLVISEQVPPPEQESTLGTSGYASLSDKVENIPTRENR